jgi:DNA helicase-2/ATP-dependent DNA helicase PcrA
MNSTEATVDRLFADLSDAQREAVAQTDGPLLILAGPGSGKTRVVTRRAAHLACTVARPREILAITFTNKAAREMRERVEALDVEPGMTLCTFHALCAKLLRWHHDRAGIAKNFTIFDRDDRRKALADAIERCGLSTTNWSPAAIEQDVSRAKNAMLSPAEFAAQNTDWRLGTVARVYEAYEKRLSELEALDFDDLLMRMALLLERDSALREDLEHRYRYVLIDEYQDTNAAQYRIARLLTQEHKNICATGDPDQSIYGWRGADIGNILSFERDYPGAKVVRLEQNYRSTKRILSAADALIASNLQRKAKSLWTENDAGAPVAVNEYESGDEEAIAVADDIASQISRGTSAGQIAVFYRVNSLSRTLEEALLRRGISYQVARGVEFYNRKEIKDVLAYLRVLVNPSDEVSLLRIINTPARGIGDTTADRLVELAKAIGKRVMDVLADDVALAQLGRAAGKVREFAALLVHLRAALDQPPAAALEFVMSHSGLRAMHHGRRDVDDAPAANLDELVSAAAAFSQEQPEAKLMDWLEHAALVSDVDAVDDERQKVTLMTLHAAKGLEFDIVYIVGLEEGLLPFQRRDGDGGRIISDVEEERRLCFVGMTRARRRLTLSLARFRMTRGVTQRTVRSPFLAEIPHDRVQSAKPARKGAIAPAAGSDRGRLPADIEHWTVGSLVRHPQLGIGQVLKLERGARRTHVDVQFRDGMRRVWVLEFADLTRVEYDEIGD